MRVKIDSTSISGSHVKVVVQKKKVKVIKRGTLKQGEESSEMMVEEGTRCSCDVLAGFSRAQTYLLMGRKKGSRLVITYIQPVNRQSSALQQVLPVLLLLLYSHCIAFSNTTSVRLLHLVYCHVDRLCALCVSRAPRATEVRCLLPDLVQVTEVVQEPAGRLMMKMIMMTKMRRTEG